MWSNLFGIQISVLEKVLRTVLVYGGLAILLRLAGKRDLAELNTFDLVVVLLLSNVVQNAIIGDDNSVSGGLLGAGVLIGVNALLVRFANRYPWLSKLFEGQPTELVRNGKVVANLHRLGLRHADVAAALRRQGAANLTEVSEATLGPGGSIVVDLKSDAQDVTVADLRADHLQLLAEIRAELQALRN